MSFEKLGNILNNANPNSGLTPKTIESAWICEIFLSYLKNEYPDIYEAIKEVAFKEGEIKVKIYGASPATELSQISNNVVEKINTKLNQKAVKRIAYRIV